MSQEIAGNPLERLFIRVRQDPRLHQLSKTEIAAVFGIISLLDIEYLITSGDLELYIAASMHLPLAWRKTANAVQVLETSQAELFEAKFEKVCAGVPIHARELVLELAAATALNLDEEPEEDERLKKIAALWDVHSLEPTIERAREEIVMPREWTSALPSGEPLTVSQRAREMALGALTPHSRSYLHPTLSQNLRYLGFDLEGAIEHSHLQIPAVSTYTLLLWADRENVVVTPYAIPDSVITEAERNMLLSANRHQFGSVRGANFLDDLGPREEYVEELAYPSKDDVATCSKIAALLGIPSKPNALHLWNSDARDYGKWSPYAMVEKPGELPQPLLPGALDKDFTHVIAVIWAG